MFSDSYFVLLYGWPFFIQNQKQINDDDDDDKAYIITVLKVISK